MTHSLKTNPFKQEESLSSKILLCTDSAKVEYFPHFIPNSLADRYLQNLREELDWQRHEVFVFGKHHFTPRLCAWNGDEGLRYHYSHKQLVAEGWSPTLQELKLGLESELGFIFNGVLANWYRDGSDHMGWHSDDESELGPLPVIASLSFGADRDFVLRNKKDPQNKIKVLLEHGSLLIMSGRTQQLYQHSLPSRKKIQHDRINLTFRYIH